MTTLPVKRAHMLEACLEDRRWLIEGLWADEAVGIIGGEPKCCKSFLALDMAVSVASGRPCLRSFPVARKGRVLLFAGEDSLPTIRERLEGIASAAAIALDVLDILVITASKLLIDDRQDRERLRNTVAELRPVLLLLDPFIRMHRIDENAAAEVAPLLAYLRELQREFNTAVALVHHAKKGAASHRPGQALRGSSEWHGWGDSNLYLRRREEALHLAVEHRAAPSRSGIPLRLLDHKPGLALSVVDDEPPSEKLSSAKRVEAALNEINRPTPFAELRQRCRIRAATLSDTLVAMTETGTVRHEKEGYVLAGNR